MKYVLMFADSVEDQKTWETMPKEQMAAAYQRVNQWFEEHGRAGKLVGGEELRGAWQLDDRQVQERQANRYGRPLHRGQGNRGRLRDRRRQRPR